jgi:hypothetical protein
MTSSKNDQLFWESGHWFSLGRLRPQTARIVVAATDDNDDEMIALGYDPQSVRDEVPAALRLKILKGLATQGFVRYGTAGFGPKLGSRMAIINAGFLCGDEGHRRGT